MKKTTWPILLVLLLLAAPVAVQAQFGYMINADGITLTITGYWGYGGAVTIPSTINGLPVTGIRTNAFYYNYNLTSVTIGTNVTSIGDCAFGECFKLTWITVDAQNSFYSSVNGVLFDKSQTTLVEYPGDASGSYTIPNSVTSIEDYAFYDCSSLTSVTIPNCVTSIGDYAFEYCNSLTNVTIGTNVTSIGDYAFEDCNGLTSVTIPNCVTSIGDYAFEYCNSLTNVTIGTNVTSIGDYAFEDCNGLASVTIPNSVTNIGDWAFGGCRSLAAITVDTNNLAYSSVAGVLFNKSTNTLIQYPGGKAGSYTVLNSVTSIGDYAFEYCTKLTSVTIGINVPNIGDYAFEYCNSLTNVTIGTNVTSIGDYAFEDCNGLASVTIPNSVTNIGYAAFIYCNSLTNVTIGTNVTSIGDWAFEDCSSLTSVTIPNSVTSIGDYAFDDCTKLTSVTIGNSVTNMGDWAFCGCTSLTSVTIPASVTSIGVEAFGGCTKLTGVYFEGNVSAPFCWIGPDVFSGDNNARVYYLPGINGWGSTFAGRPTTMLTAIAITANPTHGVVPFTVSFTSAATDSAGHTIDNWNWTFGDGSTSTDQNPSHTYSTTVTFPVVLIETGINGVPIAGSAASITMSRRIVAFTANPTIGPVPLTVQFTSAGVDNGGNTISNWNWTFGDGSTSTAQNPFHTYTTNGTFAVALIATNNIGDTVTGSGPASITAYPASLYSGLVLNSGFETGDFTGWTLSGGDPEDNFIDDGTDSEILPYSGSYLAALWSFGSLSYLSQTLATIAGAQYSISLCLNSPDGETPNEFVVFWNGNTLFDETNIPAIGWTNLQFLVSATGPSTVLEFGFRDDPSYLGLDDISVFTTALGNPPAGALQVAITPASAVKAGAEWQVDGGVWETNGAVVSGLSAETNHTLAFKVIYGWTTPSNQLVTITSGTTTTNTGVYAPQKVQDVTLAITSPKPGQSLSLTNNLFTVTGTARDTLTAKDHVAVESVYYQLNGGSWTLATPVNSWSNWTASVTLSNGANTISAYAVDTSSNASPITKVAFKYIPSATLVVSNNGNGTFSPKDNGALLAIGTNYTLTASAGKNWIFSNWVAGGGANFVSNNPVLKFTMQPNLTLTANFVTNVFLAAQGTYNGLFAPTNAPRRQTNSGAITFKITSVGVVSGKLTIGTNTPSLNGQFDPSGAATLTTTRKGLSTLTTTLKLDFDGQTASGSITDGSFVALVMADLEQKATHYDGQYTLILPGADEQAAGPLGTSCGTVTVKSGAISFGGYLADGTSVSQSSYVSTDGYWPFYLSLYGGNGSLWSWNCFTNTNGAMIIFSTNASWINATNTSKTALYRTGFTNQAASIVGSAYNATDKPLLALTNGQVMLKGGNLPATIANRFTLTSKNAVILTNAEDTNKLTLTINKSTGVISGSFANPAKPKQTIKVNGVILQGQTNAQGYFLGTNQSGTFMLMPQ